MKNCFQGSHSEGFFSVCSKQLAEEIKAMKDAEVENTSLDEWMAYYVDRFKVALVVLKLEDVSYDISETQVREYNPWSRSDPMEKQYFMRDGYAATCSVPFVGDARLFDVRPNPYSMFDTYEADVKTFRGSEEGKLVLALSFRKGSNSSEDIKEYFTGRIKEFNKCIQRNNKDAERWNDGLGEAVRSKLEERFKRLDDSAALKKGLDISPVRNQHEAAYKIPVVKKHVRKPKPSKSSPEPSITQEVFEDINNIIAGVCAIFEVSPKGFYQLEEERLRDVILATLHSHYEQGATGETFRVKGKTDINMPFEDRSAFIAECKLWKGKESLLKAVQQVFGYTTWRDSKVSLIMFNKSVKDFQGVLRTVDATLKDNYTHQNEERQSLELYGNQSRKRSPHDRRVHDLQSVLRAIESTSEYPAQSPMVTHAFVQRRIYVRAGW